MKSQKSSQLKEKTKGFGGYMANVVMAIVIALTISGIFIAIIGVNPFEAYSNMLSGVFGRAYGWGEMLVKATPLLIIGLGVSIAFKGGMTNLGGDGQFYIGALLAVIVATSISGLPVWLHMLLVFIASAVGGGLWGGIAGYLKAKLNTNEVILTIMLNYIALYLVSYMVSGPFQDPAGVQPQSKAIPEALEIPRIIQGTRAHLGIVFAVIAVVLVYIFISKSMYGYRIRAVGISPPAAVYAGINRSRQIIMIMVISGAFSGVAGMVQVFALHHRVLEGIANGVGFSAIVVALLGRLNAFGILLATLFIGGLLAGANSMQVTLGVPASIVGIIQGLVILLILISYGSKSSTFKKIFGIKESGVTEDE